MSPPTKYAILGSTGNCGRALLENLLKKPDVRIKAYCRNRAKLLRLVPDLLHDNKNVEVFEGSIQDVALLESCIRDCRAVYLVVSTNDNVPGCRMAQDTASAVIDAVRRLKEKQNINPPKLVLLSSSTIDDHLSRHMPYLLCKILLCSAHHVYKDTMEAERLIRAEESWLKGIYVKPGALSIDLQRGHALSLDEQGGPLSYLDLEAGMIDAVEVERHLYDGKNVSVVNKGGSAKFPSGTPMCILLGLISYFLPALHPYLPQNAGP